MLRVFTATALPHFASSSKAHDVITGDYLAELTMLILGRDRLKDRTLGYAKTFLRQIQDCAALIAETKTKIVVNADSSILAQSRLGGLRGGARMAPDPAPPRPEIKSYHSFRDVHHIASRAFCCLPAPRNTCFVLPTCTDLQR